ncbi:MAG: TolC family protein [Proteobacteria bacterium]|nr:TolC family protein [Pseudomonadota bacterium]
MSPSCFDLGRIAVLALAGAPLVASAQTYGPVADKPAAASSTEGDVVPSGISPELADAASRAIDANPAMRAARIGIRAAHTDIRAAKWLYGPSVSVTGYAFEGGSSVVRGDNITANLTVDQPIYQGGRAEASIARAKASERQSEAVTDETAQDLALRVTNTYFALVGANARIQALEAGLAEHRSLVGSIERRVEQEVSPRVDLDLARSRTNQLIEQQTTAKAQASASLQQLRVLLGDPSYAPAANPHYNPAIHHPDQANAVETATRCSPTRRRLQAEALVARADQKLARADYLPRVSAQFNTNEVTGNRVGIAVTAGTSGGLSQFEAEKSARLRRQAAEVRVGAADIELQTDLAGDFAENSNARERVASSHIAADSARAVTDSYQRQFVVGRRSWIDVMNAALEVTQADVAVKDAEVSAMASAARIQLRTCRWQPDPPVSRP